MRDEIGGRMSGKDRKRDSTRRREGEVESFIWTRLRWLGRVSCPDIRRVFHVSESASSRSMRSFLEKFPNWVLDTSSRLRSYEASGVGIFVRGPSSGGSMLDLVFGQSMAGKSCPDIQEWFPEIQVDLLDECLSPSQNDEIVSGICAAIASRRPVSIEYVSRNRTSFMGFSPHRLASIGARRYVRGWDSTSGKFRTLMISRIKRVERYSGEFISSRSDTAITEIVTLRFGINPSLGQEYRSMLAAEWSDRLDDDETLRLTVQRAYEFLVEKELTRVHRVEMDGETSCLPFWERVPD